VAILGSGGLGVRTWASGHSVPNRMGFRTWVIGRGKDKWDTVKNLGCCILFATTCNMYLKNFSGVGKKGEVDG
jgi:hypothetical protein